MSFFTARESGMLRKAVVRDEPTFVLGVWYPQREDYR